MSRPTGSLTGRHQTKTGGRMTVLYSRWTGMKQRCLNPNSHIWRYYGGRGITIAPEWLGRDGFDRFCDDMGNPPEGSWLDRKDNDGDYCADNCKWSTPKEQASNRRKGGPSPDPKSLRQKAITVGLPYHVLYQRVKLLGWTLKKALETPKHEHGKHPRENQFDGAMGREFGVI